MCVCVCVCVRERERGRERERASERASEREPERERARQRGREREGERESARKRDTASALARDRERCSSAPGMELGQRSSGRDRQRKRLRLRVAVFFIFDKIKTCKRAVIETCPLVSRVFEFWRGLCSERAFGPSCEEGEEGLGRRNVV